MIWGITKRERRERAEALRKAEAEWWARVDAARAREERERADMIAALHDGQGPDPTWVCREGSLALDCQLKNGMWDVFGCGPTRSFGTPRTITVTNKTLGDSELWHISDMERDGWAVRSVSQVKGRLVVVYEREIFV